MPTSFFFFFADKFCVTFFLLIATIEIRVQDSTGVSLAMCFFGSVVEYIGLRLDD